MVKPILPPTFRKGLITYIKNVGNFANCEIFGINSSPGWRGGDQNAVRWVLGGSLIWYDGIWWRVLRVCRVFAGPIIPLTDLAPHRHNYFTHYHSRPRASPPPPPVSTSKTYPATAGLPLSGWSVGNAMAAGIRSNEQWPDWSNLWWLSLIGFQH